MATHFSDIGFAPGNEGLGTAITAGVQEGEVFKTPRGALIFWSPGEGVEIWSQINELDGRNILADCNPHFSGSACMRVGLLDVRTYDGRPSDGSIFVKTALHGTDPCDGEGALLLDVPNFDLVRDRFVEESIITLQVSAFADTITCYATEKDFMESQSPIAEFEGSPVYLGPELTIPHEVEDGISSFVHMTARVCGVSRVTNPWTGIQFYHLTVTTLGGGMDIVVDPTLLESEPQAGGVVRGNFWLSAKLVENGTNSLNL